MIGEKLSPILVEIENTIWEYESEMPTPPGFTDEAFRAAAKIFMSALMDKMYKLQVEENIAFIDRLNMATEAGLALRKLVKTFTGIETQQLY